MVRMTAAAVAATAALALALTGAATAQDKKATELRYTTGAPEKTPWVTPQLRRFEQDVAEESGGKLKISSFVNAQLGNEQDTVQQVARGRIDMGGFSNGAVALIVPELSLLGLPFYFKNIAEQDCTVDAMTKTVSDLLAKKGVKFLGWTEVGTADIVGKKPYLVPADVKGLKAASASNKVSAAMWSTLGANPTPIGITEIASAFQTGLTDINSTVVTFYLPSGLAKVAPVLSRVELSDAPGIILMNKAAYDKLPAAERAALDKALARRSATQLRQEIRGFEATLRDMHVKAGGTIATPTPEQREEWRKVLQPVWPKMVQEVGGEAQNFYKQMEAARASCDKKS
ncbi:TRAP transporter substrate-binding protein DctP [Reyranella massiliensis]|uniref:TRAP transporter substrate-binding protein DctP n=1 Tax=Reyranella massiliensis TaxID=445220 RepID=UPI0003001ACE|nr:TRAP transporter substrate-binding protein DctP [Reyranella massiliensis]